MNNDIKQSGLCIAGMVCGILSLVLFWIPFVGFVLAIGGIVLGVRGMKECDEGLATGKGMGVAGLVTGIIGLLPGTLALIFMLAYGTFVSYLASIF